MSNYIRLSLHKPNHAKFGLENKTFLIWQTSRLNSELPTWRWWIASTRLFESVSTIMWDMPLCSNSHKVSSKAMDSPSMTEQLPSIHEVPTTTKPPTWSRNHHPPLVLFLSRWKPASTLHLYQPSGGFCHRTTWFCCVITGCPACICWAENHSSHNCLALCPKFLTS
jgi:hypothetical protein